MKLTHDGLREILISTALLGVGGGLASWAAMAASPWLWLVAGPLWLIWLFTLAFFRDPDRAVPKGAGLLVSPADGRVTNITPLEHDERIGGPAVQIGIFLSIFDVHINRTPCGGRVVRTDYRPGQFLDARHPEAGIRNEANTIMIDPEAGIPGPVIVRQIAGVIARRVVCNVRPGTALQRGQHVGMIKFGSRTELIVPAGCGIEPAVSVNDHVKAGSTILMRAVRTAEDNRCGGGRPASATGTPGEPVRCGASHTI